MTDLLIFIGSCSLFILSLIAALNFYFQKRWRLFLLMLLFVLLGACCTSVVLYQLLVLSGDQRSTVLLPFRPL